jgi:hypothetical protein
MQRFLSRPSVPPYVCSPAVAMRHEPEAVPEDDQQRLTCAASDRELRVWTVSRGRLLAELEHLCAHVHSPHVTRGARALEREIQALDRKLL